MNRECEACRGNVAPGKSCYACGRKGPCGEGLTTPLADLQARHASHLSRTLDSIAECLSEIEELIGIQQDNLGCSYPDGTAPEEGFQPAASLAGYPAINKACLRLMNLIAQTTVANSSMLMELRNYISKAREKTIKERAQA